MTGPEHYREAERLLDEVMSSSTVRPNVDAINLAAAQVHATLALAAATLAAAEHTAAASYDAAGGYRPPRLVQQPLPGDEFDQPYPGNDWGRALYGEVAQS